MKRKKVWGILIFGALCVATFFIALFLSKEQKRDIHINGIRSVGTVSAISDTRRAKFLTMDYVVDGVAYSFTTKLHLLPIYQDEQYTIAYLPNDPDYISIYFDQPVYEADEIGIAKCATISKNLSVITFRYFVGNISYGREIWDRDDQSLNPEDYEIHYFLNRPEVGYLIGKR